MRLSPTLTTYNGHDDVVTYEAKVDLETELAEFGLTHYYLNYLQPLVSAVYAMQMRGMPVDLGRMEEAKRERLSKMGRLREELRGCAAIIGEPEYNPNSNPQTAKLLREFGYHSGRTTDKGAPKADKAEIITALLKTAGSPTEAIFSKIVDYRGESKDYGTFLAGPRAKPRLHIRPWPDGRIRTRFLVTTRTGRLQSRKWSTAWGVGPEFQNIPDDIRRIYCAPPGYVFVQADAAQLELVLMANAARVKVWLDAIAEGKSVHIVNMVNVMKFTEEGALHAKKASDPSCPTHERCHRQYVTIKKFVFADNYWAEVPTIQEQLLTEARILVPLPTLESIMASYRSFIPEIQSWRNRQYQAALATREIRTTLPDGSTRLRRLLEPRDKLRGISVNDPIQSTGAHFINFGFLALHERGCPLVNQVHDSVLVLCRREDRNGVADAIREAYQHKAIIEGREVAIKMEPTWGESWGAMEGF